MPDSITEQECKDCEAELTTLQAEKETCEKEILEVQKATSERIAAHKKYYADVDEKMASFQPQINKLQADLHTKYEQEKTLYKEAKTQARTLSGSVSFLQHQMARQGNDDLIDRWMSCDDNRKGARIQLNGCRTKAKSVQMWSETREKPFKEKADKYITRVARLPELVEPMVNEDTRVDATISRLKTQMPCPETCDSLNCQAGDAGNGGEALASLTIRGTSGCTHYCSRIVAGSKTSYCGAGQTYTSAENVDCTSCARLSL